jgi:hypothetical protein
MPPSPVPSTPVAPSRTHDGTARPPHPTVVNARTVDRGRPDPSVAVIGLCERLGPAHEVRPPTRDRFAARRA